MYLSQRTSAPFLAITWLLLLPTLFFVSRGQFSFEHIDINDQVAYQFGGAICSDSDTLYYKIEQAALYCSLVAAMFPLIYVIFGVFKQKTNLVLLLLPSWAIASMVWSQNPAKTVAAAAPVYLLTSFGVYLAKRFNAEQQITFFLFVGFMALSLSIMLALFYPQAGIAQFDGKGEWQGLWVHKNQCATVMTYLLLPGFCYRARTGPGRLARGSYLISCLGVIILTQSRTGWLLAGCVLFFFATVSGLSRFANREKMLIFVVAASSILIIAFAVITNFVQISALLGKSATLTGRTDIWKAIFAVLWERPFLGFGYRAFWLGMNGESAALQITVGSIGLANAENAVLQMWLELGIVGVVLMLVPLARACRNSFYCLLRESSSRILWPSSIVFLAVLALIDGDKVMFPHTIEWVLFVMAFVNLTDERRRIQLRVRHECSLVPVVNRRKTDDDLER